MPPLIVWALLILGLVFSVLSWLNASSASAAWKVLYRGPFAGRELYTPAGWRYRNFALLCGALAAVIMLVLGAASA